VGGEALVEQKHRHFEAAAQRSAELLGRTCLLSTLAPQRQWMPDDDLLGSLVRDEPLELGEPVGRGGSPHDAQGPRDRSGRVGNSDAGARAPEVERHHLHASAAATACLPASSAVRTPAGFLPPASASVGLPPPPP